MATLGLVPFAGLGAPHDSAAAFELVLPPRGSVVQQLDDAEAEARPDVPYLVVRFNGACDADSARSLGLDFAQRCLDMMSIQGAADLLTKRAPDESIVSWREPAGQVVQISSTTTFSFSVSSPTLIVRDAEGNEVKRTPPLARHHPAFRYFRLSQTSEDLYEAFRNAYLSFELLLSWRYPPQSHEREREWLRRAVGLCDSELDLGRFFRPKPSDVPEAVLKQVYTATRLPLFHAKSGRDVLTPMASESDRRDVQQTLELLTAMVLAMAEAWCDARRMGGGVFFGWVYQNLRSIYASARILVMRDDEPFRKDQRDLTEDRYADAVPMRTEIHDDPDDSRAPMLWGEVPVTSLGSGDVRKIEVVGDSAPILGHRLESALTLEDCTILQYRDRTAITNTGRPRTRFPR